MFVHGNVVKESIMRRGSWLFVGLTFRSQHFQSLHGAFEEMIP
jgi:hypothetical protein